MKKIIILLFTCLLYSVFLKAQVTIGSGYRPQPGTLLDLKMEESSNDVTSTKGLLMPRLELVSSHSLEPILTNASEADMKQHIGLVVYNLTNDSYFSPSFYFWSGTQWLPFDENNITLIVDKESNSFIVPIDVVRIDIPTTKASDFWSNYELPGFFTAFSFNPENLNTLAQTNTVEARLLWSDKKDMISRLAFNKGPAGKEIEEGMISVFVKEKKAGNALVALYINNEIRWSWHLWFTDYDPNPVAATTVGQTSVKNGYIYRYNNSSIPEGNYVFMDRNLGSSSNELLADFTCLFYQWGRKDPFPAQESLDGTAVSFYGINGDALSYSTGNSTSNPLKESINRPNKFIITAAATAFNDDWMLPSNTSVTVLNTPTGILKNMNQFLWNNGNAKTYFDPCPKGWKVPPMNNGQQPWNLPESDSNSPSAYSTEAYNNGYDFNKPNFMLGNYPAIGFISGITGVQQNTGITGIVWSSSPNTMNLRAMGLEFNNADVDPTFNIRRSHGGTVRCVQETKE